MDWNKHNIVYFLSSPPACVSPTDPTLTVENVTEVMGEVGDLERVARFLSTLGFGVPDSKLQEIKWKSSSKRDRSHLLGQYWVTDPDTSWRKLASVLYSVGETRALTMVKQYLPKGIYAFPDYLKLALCSVGITF